MSLLPRLDPSAAEQARLAAEHTRLREACAEALHDLRVYRQACPLPSVILMGLDATISQLRAALTPPLPPPPPLGPLGRRIAERRPR